MLPTGFDDFTVVLDTCILVPPLLRDVIFTLAQAGAFTVRFSEDTLIELDDVLRRSKFRMTAEQVTYLLGEIRQNLEDWIVTGYRPITINSLPDPKDVHVVQAAVKSEAQQIITYNLKDFPNEILAPLDLEVQTPDIFLESAFDLHPRTCCETIERWLVKNQRPPQTKIEFLMALQKHDLRKAAERAARWAPFSDIWSVD